MTSETPSLLAGTTRLFTERTAAARLEINLDAYGFVKPSSGFFRFEALLERPCTLVVAPPWIGKTFTAGRIDTALREVHEPEDISRSLLHEFTDLEAGSLAQPSWWKSWREGQRTATWIIDALDEGQRRETTTCPALLRILRELSPEQRRRLRLLIFGREGELVEVARGFDEELRSIFGEGFVVSELLPLDEENAREVLAAESFGDEDWTRLLNLIKRNNLQGVAGYPAALLFLARQPAGTQLTSSDVWKGVLHQLLEEHARYRPRPFTVHAELRFSAAARIGAVLTLAGQEQLGDRSGASLPSVAQIFPVPEPSYLKATRVAALEALRSGMFRASADGYRFLHKNVREWMAAFGLARLPLVKLRPVLQAIPTSPEPTPSLRAELSDFAQLLREVHEEGEVRNWIDETLEAAPSDLFIQDIKHVCALLDRLEQLAARGGRPDWIDDAAAAGRLVVPGIGEELAGRLRDDKRPADARIAVLRIGAVLALDEVLVAASAIVRDTSQGEGLRSWCASSIRRSGRADLLRTLEAFVESAVPKTRVEKEIVSTLLAALVEQGLWTTARAFRFISKGPASRVIDATSALPFTLERRMTVEDAEEIVSSLDAPEMEALNDAAEARFRAQELRAEPRWQAYAAAAKKLASMEPSDSARLRRLIPFVLSLGNYTWHHERELITALEVAFRASEAGRRELFETAVKAEKSERAQDRRPWWWMYRVLAPEDLDWLLERLATLAEGAPEVWQVALHLADRTENATKRRRIRAAVRRMAPDALSGYEKYRAQQKESERQELRRKEKEEAQRRNIEEVDRELLSNAGLGPQRRLWQLSWVNFSDDDRRPRNLAGTWSEVSEDLQQEVLKTCAAALDSIEPTPVPEGSSFPASLVYEAQAFAAQLKLSPESFELTSARIERWLPAALRVLYQERNELLARCFQAEAEATEKILLDTIAREIRAESAYSVLLQDLPASLWTEKVTRWVAESVEGSQRPQARARLLELLAARRPEVGLRVAKAVLGGRSVSQILALADGGLVAGEPEDLGMQALEVLLALDPNEVWPAIEQGAALGGEKFLERLRGLTSNARDGLQVRWREWPPERVARLCALLFAVYPPESDPPDQSGWITPAYEFRLLRWRLIEHLVRSNTPGTPAAIDTASQIHPRAREWVEHLQATTAANTLLPQPSAAIGLGIPVAAACRLLDEVDYRVIRSENDLLEVVVEELGRFAGDLGYDYPMLLHPIAGEATEQRRREEALQAYIARRLADRLPGKVLDRETQVQWRQRSDIRVMAPAVDRQEPARVVIEVKWSDNSDPQRGVSTGLKEKLGKEYLLGEGLKHGVFLVGWTGKLGTWKRSAGSPPREKTAASLEEALRRQAEEFRREEPTIDIRPAVWNLERASTSPKPAAIPPRRRGRKRSKSRPRGKPSS